uniref:non-specific serine/threonine protein kinase n=1 Tax=Noccaea caerulescens TaxID=107243 RepID=A0A1J3IKX2_NOCCA
MKGFKGFSIYSSEFRETMVGQKKTTTLPVFFFFFILLLESTFEQQTSSSVEKSALLALRSSLGLRGKDWPVKGDPCLNWNGVKCDRNDRVTKINISGFRRTRIGNQNPEFSVGSLVNLTRLTSFNASSFSLPGPIPVLFGSSVLTLEVLDLSSCSITGTIPTSLSRLSRLTVLDLSSNSLTGSIPASLGALSKLQRLNLSRNGLSSSTPLSLGDLSALIDLDLSFNDLSGSVPSELKELRDLQTLVIAGNRLSGSLPPDLFSSLSKLQIVDFKSSGLTGVLPSRLLSLPDLTMLDLSGNQFSDELPNTTVSFDSTTVSLLNISGNMFYGNLTLLLKRFKVVDLSRNYFQGKVPDFIPISASSSSSSSSLRNNCLQGPTNQRELSDCALFYSKKGLTFDNFGQQKRSRKSPGLSHRAIVILAAVGGSILVMLILILLPVTVSFCVRRRRNRSSTSGRHNGVGPLPPDEAALPSSRGGGVSINFASLGSSFSYQQLLNATKEFRDSNLIKKGQSGDVFKGVLETGVQIVVKRISLESTKNSEAYLTELDFFSRFAHPRIVPFLGKCLEGTSLKFLVYKYMPNRDLPSSLFYKSNSIVDDGLKSLDWITRLKIALGAAEGLSYLHHDCSPSIVHRDVQASSILLDDKFEVRLGSFSKACHQENNGRPRKIARLLSRLSQSSQESVPGSPATATCAYDVFCFGKILLELITGKLGISSCEEPQFKKMLTEILPHISSQEKEPVTNILDQSLLVDEDLLEEVWAMAIVARSCLNPKPSKRPLMRHIVQALENPLRVVREDSSESERFRTTGSSRGSSSSGRVFGSWRQSVSDPVAAGTSSLLSQAEGLGRTSGAMGSSARESSRGASSRRSMKDV